MAAPFEEEGAADRRLKIGRVKIPLSQHIGAAAIPVVSAGDRVVGGQLIGRPAEGLSTGIHASIDGIVEKVNEREIVIKEK